MALSPPLTFLMSATIVAACLIPHAVALPAGASETPTTVPAADMELADPDKEHERERAEIEKLLKTIEDQWNAHNLEAVMSHYADDYINNDGLDKKAVAALTQDFWKTYPDARSSSKTKQIRIEGPFVTVDSLDTASGTTAKELPGIGSKGDLRSVSEGQLYIRKLGPAWKIIGDRIDYERVRVSFGLAKQLQAEFSAPEQVKAGRQYSAKIELNLPAGLQAVGSITNQTLQYPQPQPTDAWRPLEYNSLERVLHANNKGRNELLMATIGVTNSTRNSLMGIAFLTRRLNVIPPMEEPEASATTEKKPEKALELKKEGPAPSLQDLKNEEKPDANAKPSEPKEKGDDPAAGGKEGERKDTSTPSKP